MAVQSLYGVPPKATLPLVKGEDVDVDFIYKPMALDENDEPILVDGEPVYEEGDFPDGAVLSLVIDPNIVGVAEIDGSRAKINIDHSRVDRVRVGALWRLVLTVDEFDRVLMNGKITRSDGQ